MDGAIAAAVTAATALATAAAAAQAEEEAAAVAAAIADAASLPPPPPPPLPLDHCSRSAGSRRGLAGCTWIVVVVELRLTLALPGRRRESTELDVATGAAAVDVAATAASATDAAAGRGASCSAIRSARDAGSDSVPGSHDDTAVATGNGTSSIAGAAGCLSAGAAPGATGCTTSETEPAAAVNDAEEAAAGATVVAASSP